MAGDTAAVAPGETGLAELEEIQRRVLWLSTLMIDHANRVRPNPSGIKVGGHQASSASVVSILTSLLFDFMLAGDKLSVKPHASPVLHAAHYLLGNLDREALKTLRQFHGLQAYPSRTKDPDPVDFSTGSVGLGSVAPNFAALADRYVATRTGRPSARRFISLVGDAELDEGSIWEAVAEPALAGLDNLIWIVDLNRQSLDRVVPGIRVRQLEEMFRSNGWTVLEAKYGNQLQAAFARPGGRELRRRIDEMPNERYQMLLRAPAGQIREAFGEALFKSLDDPAVRRLVADLGGHNLALLRTVLAEAASASGPAVIFAYTIKGWGLPIAGDPLNHSAMISAEELEGLRLASGVESGREWDTFPPGSAAADLCRRRSQQLGVSPAGGRAELAVPDALDREYRGRLSTQRVFGQVLVDVRRQDPELGGRLVTMSADVATSTNLGGWINRVRVWEPADAEDLFSALGPRLIEWMRRPSGQHLELGLSETNLVMALGQFGLTAELFGETLLPIGTLYDPFVARALDAYVYGLYAGSRFILVGTPSGVTLAPEGGAHQSIITPSIGVALPGVTYWEPCFARELEWIVLESLAALTRPGGESSYLRLSTAPIDQGLMPKASPELRRQVLEGAYTIIDRSPERGWRPGHNAVEIWTAGAMVPVALAAARELRADGVFAGVVNCVSPSRVFGRWQSGGAAPFGGVGRPPVPVVTVADAHPSALAWVGSMLGARCVPLGVTDYGESGLPDELYARFGIDAEGIALACFAALG